MKRIVLVLVLLVLTSTQILLAKGKSLLIERINQTLNINNNLTDEGYYITTLDIGDKQPLKASFTDLKLVDKKDFFSYAKDYKGNLSKDDNADYYLITYKKLMPMPPFIEDWGFIFDRNESRRLDKKTEILAGDMQRMFRVNPDGSTYILYGNGEWSEKINDSSIKNELIQPTKTKRNSYARRRNLRFKAGHNSEFLPVGLYPSELRPLSSIVRKDQKIYYTPYLEDNFYFCNKTVSTGWITDVGINTSTKQAIIVIEQYNMSIQVPYESVEVKNGQIWLKPSEGKPFCSLNQNKSRRTRFLAAAFDFAKWNFKEYFSENKPRYSFRWTKPDGENIAFIIFNMGSLTNNPRIAFDGGIAYSMLVGSDSKGWEFYDTLFSSGQLACPCIHLADFRRNLNHILTYGCNLTKSINYEELRTFNFSKVDLYPNRSSDINIERGKW
jgi:hypothetical protein